MERLQEFLKQQQEQPSLGRPVRNRPLRHVPIWIWPATAGVTVVIGIVVWVVADSLDREGKQKLVTSNSAPVVSEPAASELVPIRPDQAPVANPPQPPATDGTSGPEKNAPVSLSNAALPAGAQGGSFRSSAHGVTTAVTAVPANENSLSSKSIERPDHRPNTELGSAAPAALTAMDLSGWENPEGAWRVQQGMLLASVGADEKTLAVLRSKEKYKDFDLKFRVRLKDGSGNCGVRFRTPEDEPTDGKADGVECVIHRTERDKTYAIGSLAKGSTDKPDVFSARGSAARFVKAGDFNQVHIRCEGEQVVIRVNHMTTISKTLTAIADEGYIALELDGRNQLGEVEFKDFKFTDLRHPTNGKFITRSPAGSDSIVKAKAQYFQSVEKAGKKLVAAFDSAIKQRTDQPGDAKGNQSGTIAILESEKVAFMKKGHIPWSKAMRSATEAYMGELDSYQRRMEKAFEDEINQARKHGDPQTITQLQAAEDAFLAPHLVATAEFEGARLRFRSDGLVENSKDQIARRWWIPAHRHTDLP
ncbi:MAG TPA: family 16 glycoside hydrolase, partial [Planctomycetaceae bacterium]|nr:family 16 glycoside hydrolase [Planctomycetaceae bacterium]